MSRKIFCALILVLFSTSPLFAADWGVFRGPNGDNKSSDTGLLKKWSEDGPKLLWTADFIGFGYSSVSISGDRIYTAGNVERNGKMLSMVFCLDLNGKKIWEQDNGAAHTERRKYPGTRGTPTVDGDFVYDVTPSGETACFDAKTGKKIWNRNILKDYAAATPQWLIGYSAVVDGNNLICPLGGSKHSAVALDKRTGKTVWESSPVAEPAGYTTPYLFEWEGMRIVAIISDVTVELLEAGTGKQLATIPWENSRGTNVTMPIYRNGNLFLTTGYGFGSKLYKLAKSADGKLTATEVWYEKSFDNHHGDVVLVDDYVYGTTHRGSWGAIHFLTGEVGYLARSIGSGSVHYADGLIYGLSEDNKTVILLKPEPKQYVELGRFELPNDAEGKSWAHPVVCGGKLYLRHAQYLYCYDVKAP